MIARAHRFHGHNSLRFVYSRGEIVRGQYFSLKYINNPRRKSYRAAVVVSRKVHKSAVVRNRIRRRMYELIRLYVPANVAPYDLVFVVYSDMIASMSPAELQEQLLGHLKKAGVVADNPNQRDIVEERS